MPARDLYQVTIPPGADSATAAMVSQINRHLLSIAMQLAKQEGLEGRTVQMSGPIDLGRNRVSRVSAPVRDGDVAARGVVAQQGAFSRATNERVVVDQVIEATEGVQVPIATVPTEAPALSQLDSPAFPGLAIFGGGVVVGSGGATITRVLSGTASLNFGNVLAQTSSDLTIAVAGAAISDQVALGVDAVSVKPNSSYGAWVSASGTVTVRFNNYSAAALDPDTGTFKVLVVQTA